MCGNWPNSRSRASLSIFHRSVRRWAPSRASVPVTGNRTPLLPCLNAKAQSLQLLVKPQNRPKYARCSSSTVHRLDTCPTSPLHTHPARRCNSPKVRHRVGKSDRSERWLEPPFLLRELLRGHVDVLRDAESKTSVHLRRTCPPSKKALATGHPSRLCGSSRAFAGQLGICVVAKPPDEVQRSFFMPQIEVVQARWQTHVQVAETVLRSR